jgi:anti-anti-sigma regulatory factor
MRYIAINLSGMINESLSESLQEHVETILKEPSAILLDFTRVTKVDDSGIQLLCKVLNRIQETGKDRVALSSVGNEISSKIKSSVSFPLPVFDSKSEAKSFLEKMNVTRTNERLESTQYFKVTQFTQKGNIYYVNCPGCAVKLRIRSIGNHACPSCKTRFHFKPDIPEPTTNPETHYEMLSLD